MRKLIILFVFSVFVSCSGSHQNAVLHITLENSISSSCHVYIKSQPMGGMFDIPLHSNHTGNHTFKLTQPEFADVSFNSADGKELHYIFYLSPEDNIDFNADLSQWKSDIKVNGKGSENNQRAAVGHGKYQKLTGFKGDTLPYRVINAIKEVHKKIKKMHWLNILHPLSAFPILYK